MGKKPQTEFMAKHHALLFAWLAKDITSLVGEEQASPVLHRAVRRYGEQRGHRMALRAQANGHDLSMLSWLAYPEWKAGKGETVMKIVQKRPAVRINMPLCPWYTTWKNEDLLAHGTCYCEEIDASVVRGFNPELRIDVNEIKPHGADACDMVFHGADLSPRNLITFLVRKFIAIRNHSIMPWEYHIGHVYKTIGEELISAFGDQGRKACETALETFAQRFGDLAATRIRNWWNTDFNVLPAR